MTMNVSVDRLPDRDVAWLADCYDELAADADPRWQVWATEVTAALRGELARRRIAAAVDADPLGYFWQGRLD
jgi:hypothetical protein